MDKAERIHLLPGQTIVSAEKNALSTKNNKNNKQYPTTNHPDEGGTP